MLEKIWSLYMYHLVVSNDGKLESLLFGDTLVSTDVKVLRILPENSNGITVWLDVGSGLSSLN